jgi:hypothetical protein
MLGLCTKICFSFTSVTTLSDLHKLYQLRDAVSSCRALCNYNQHPLFRGTEENHETYQNIQVWGWVVTQTNGITLSTPKFFSVTLFETSSGAQWWTLTLPNGSNWVRTCSPLGRDHSRKQLRDASETFLLTNHHTRKHGASRHQSGEPWCLLRSVSNSKKHLELLGFWTLSSSGILETIKHDVSGTGSVSVLRWRGKTPTQLGPLEGANLNHCQIHTAI